MEYDPDYLSAVTREQDRLIAEGIARAKASQAARASWRCEDSGLAIAKAAVRQVNLERFEADRYGDLPPQGKQRARSDVQFVTYAAHKARHAAKTA